MKMYIFEAHYINMPTGKELIKSIEFNEQFLDTERECYLYAMGRAFDLRDVGDMFASLEFIGC